VKGGAVLFGKKKEGVKQKDFTERLYMSKGIRKRKKKSKGGRGI